MTTKLLLKIMNSYLIGLKCSLNINLMISILLVNLMGKNIIDYLLKQDKQLTLKLVENIVQNLQLKY